MTNTHRKTTNRTTAKIAAVGAFGLGAAIAFPGLAAAQTEAPTDPTASLADMAGDDGSLEGALGTDLNLDLGSLTFNLNLDAETPTPGSVELGSLGVSPNTGSALIDGASGSAGDDTETGAATGSATGDETEADSGSLDLGSLGSSDETTDGTDGVATAAVAEEAPATTGSLGSGDETTDETATDETDAGTGSLSGSLAGLSSGAEEGDDTTGETGTVTADVNADAGLDFGSLG